MVSIRWITKQLSWFCLLCCMVMLVSCSNTTTPTPDGGAVDGGVHDGDTKPKTKPHKTYPLDDVLRLNHIQVVGTHNSYHLKPTTGGVKEWQFSHAPLDEQLEKQGVRQFEIDIHWDTEKNTFVVRHIPLLDPRTTCELYSDCLKVMKKWSDQSPQHLPIFVFIEPKDKGQFKPFPIKDAYGKLDEITAQIIPKDRMITPDSLRGKHATLKEALEKDGWPTLGKVRGKFVFVLLGGGLQKEYSHGDKHLKGRLMFMTSGVDKPYTAVTAIDDPFKEEEIKKAVKANLIIRTRADSGLEGDPKRLEAALRGGGHILSTDFPIKRDIAPGYIVQMPGGKPARCNPITAPAKCTPEALENF